MAVTAGLAVPDFSDFPKLRAAIAFGNGGFEDVVTWFITIKFCHGGSFGFDQGFRIQDSGVVSSCW